METTLIPKFIALPVSLLISLVFTVSIIDLARKLKLYDANNHLKQHREKVCSLGGISIFAAFWISACLFLKFNGSGVARFLFIGAFILFLTGVKDDLVGIPALKRLLVQIGVASLMFWGGLRLTYLPGFDIELPIVISYLLTTLLIGAIVNAYNFIDGINGLAGGLAAISSLAFAFLFHFSGLENLAVMALALSGSIFGFLYFNFRQAKIFMGDNGSTFIGVMLSFFAISFFQNHALNGGPIEWQPALVPAILIVPMFDMLKVIGGRMMKGASPFKGDRKHVHHLFLNAGAGQDAACYVLYVWNISVILFSLKWLSNNFVIGLLMVALFGCLPYIGLYFFSKYKKEKSRPKLHATNASDAY
ncbi:MAG TPA: undecaprenyl/decaprenyl-phosphate alpha-N-acetylglucosaminyl 1-phosphate transferase [Bacteroidetes bacterium]|nr:undecaprenyl/decaprenyl-phosphate alpha-N-acetylglucosaminyl 1-phosphate transferase [Bacteroidota bacterium]